MKFLSTLVLSLLLVFSGVAQASHHAEPMLPSELLEMLRTPVAEAPTGVECDPKAPHCVVPYRLAGPIDGRSVRNAIAFLKAANDAKVPMVMIEINTHGGSVDDGFELMRAIEMSHSTVACTVDGNAGSMGFFILQSCDIRVMTKRSVLMAHQILAVDIERINAAQAAQLAQRLVVMFHAFAEQVVERSKGHIDMKTFLEKTDNIDWHMGWEEGMKYGFVDSAVAGTANTVYGQLVRNGKVDAK